MKKKSEGKKSAKGKAAPDGKKKKVVAPPNPMPSLIFGGGALSTASGTSTDKKTSVQKETVPVWASRIGNNYNPTAERWLWAGVIILTTIIAVLWGFALKLQLSTVNFSKSPEQELISKTKADWDAAFAAGKKEQAEKAAVQTELQTIIATLLSQTPNAATTTASSTTAVAGFTTNTAQTVAGTKTIIPKTKK